MVIINIDHFEMIQTRGDSKIHDSPAHMTNRVTPDSVGKVAFAKHRPA
jgi:hypothetical protein